MASVSHQALLMVNTAAATARSATVMGPAGVVMVNTTTTQRDANADSVMINSR